MLTKMPEHESMLIVEQACSNANRNERLLRADAGKVFKPGPVPPQGDSRFDGIATAGRVCFLQAQHRLDRVTSGDRFGRATGEGMLADGSTHLPQCGLGSDSRRASPSPREQTSLAQTSIGRGVIHEATDGSIRNVEQRNSLPVCAGGLFSLWTHHRNALTTTQQKGKA